MSAVPAKQLLTSTKNNLRLATTAALPGPNVYANGTNSQPQAGNGGVGATLTGPANTALGNLDGVAPVVGDRVLVNTEAAGANNGFYTVTALGGASSQYVLTRCTDCDTSGKIGTSFAVVTAGATNAGKIAYLLLDTDVSPITVGTTALVWSFLAPGSAGAGAIVTTAPFTTPVANSTQAVTINTNAPIAPGTLVRIGGANTDYGLWLVTATSTTTGLTLANLGISGNLGSGTVIATGAQLTPVKTPDDLAVSTVTLLAALNASGFKDGARVFSLDVRDTFVLQLNAPPLTAVSNNVVAAAGVTGGFWVRQSISSSVWQQQTTWFLSATGSDSANGLTAGTALLTWAELKRRTHVNGVWRLFAATTITAVSAPADGIDLEVDPLSATGGQVALLLNTNAAAGTATTITAVTAAVPSTNQPMVLTFAAPIGPSTIVQDTSQNGGNAYLTTGASVTGAAANTYTSTALAQSFSASVSLPPTLANAGTGLPVVGDSVAPIASVVLAVKKLWVYQSSNPATTANAVCQGLTFSPGSNTQGLRQLPLISGVTFQGCYVNVPSGSCNHVSSIVTSVVFDAPNYLSTVNGLNASFFYFDTFTGNASLLTRNSTPQSATQGPLLQGCSIVSLTLGQGSFAVFNKVQLDGALTVSEYAKLKLPPGSSNNLYGGSLAVGTTPTAVFFDPFANVSMGNQPANCTISAANSIQRNETAATIIWGPMPTSGGAWPVDTTLTNWGSGAGGLNAAPFNGQALSRDTLASITLA